MEFCSTFNNVFHTSNLEDKAYLKKEGLMCGEFKGGVDVWRIQKRELVGLKYELEELVGFKAELALVGKPIKEL